MSKKTFVCSDWHIGHSNICKFLDSSGNRIRPFDNIDQHDEALITYHNELVGEHDRVYVLGDVVINKKFLYKLSRFKGKKVLIMGNHDIFEAKEYLQYFEDIRSYKMYPALGIVMSHIPVLLQDPNGRFKVNVHGHLHSNIVVDQYGKPDKRYINVCVEHTGWKPVQLDELIERAKGA